MKEYEKLAEQSSLDCIMIHSDHEDVVFRSAYERGFLKSREMAIELLSHSDYGLPDLRILGEKEV